MAIVNWSASPTVAIAQRRSDYLDFDNDLRKIGAIMAAYGKERRLKEEEEKEKATQEARFKKILDMYKKKDNSDEKSNVLFDILTANHPSTETSSAETSSPVGIFKPGYVYDKTPTSTTSTLPSLYYLSPKDGNYYPWTLGQSGPVNNLYLDQNGVKTNLGASDNYLKLLNMLYNTK